MIHPDDWTAVAQGRKTEFRTRRVVHSHIEPTATVGYTERGGRVHHKLLVIEARWREPLGAITEESIEREGFPDIAHFRRYWMDRYKTKYRPMEMVTVHRVRPFVPDVDEIDLARLLFKRVFGEFYDGSL